MEYNRKQLEQLKAREVALKISMGKILGNKAEMKAECDGNGKSIVIEGDGSKITQLWIAAAQAAQIINTFGSDSKGRYTLFLAAIEMQRNHIGNIDGVAHIEIEV